MESPAPLLFLGCFLASSRRSAADVTFLALWLLHYAYRAWIYPFRLRGGQLRMPLSIVAMAFCFNLMNGYIQGRGLYALGPEHPTAWLLDPRFLIGVVLFLGGWFINQQSDVILRRLRRPGDTSYHIPFGGAYRWVSCPNYFGELVEWLGWAILTWSPAGLVFFFWSAANLVPRARTHHRWYREHFADYPRERRALIPFLF